MIFKRFDLNEQNLGLVAHHRQFEFVFGNKLLSRELLTEVFPHSQFCFLKQEHGAVTVLADGADQLSADAHYSIDLKQALVIQTADCLPILLHHDQLIMAIHAGWRGLVQKIIDKSLNLVTQKYGLDRSRWHVAIGPHIRQESFEVDRDILPELLADFFGDTRSVVKNHANEKKAWVDLSQIAQYQLQKFGIKKHQIVDVEIDTAQSLDYASYRRESGTSVRQYSFVRCLTKF